MIVVWLFKDQQGKKKKKTGAKRAPQCVATSRKIVYISKGGANQATVHCVRTLKYYAFFVTPIENQLLVNHSIETDTKKRYQIGR